MLCFTIVLPSSLAHVIIFPFQTICNSILRLITSGRKVETNISNDLLVIFMQAKKYEFVKKCVHACAYCNETFSAFK